MKIGRIRIAEELIDNPEVRELLENRLLVTREQDEHLNTTYLVTLFDDQFDHIEIPEYIMVWEKKESGLVRTETIRLD